MNTFLKFFSTTKPSKSADDTLIDFLVQCDAQGVHFQFSSSMNRSQLNSLIDQLHLSDEDRKAQLTLHLSLLSSFTLGSNALLTSIDQHEKITLPCQVCDNCVPGLFDHYGEHLADASWCSQCNEKKDCLDLPLIEHYRKHDIDDETICHHLPKTRWDSDASTFQSIEDIETVYQWVFEAARQNTNTMK